MADAKLMTITHVIGNSLPDFEELAFGDLSPEQRKRYAQQARELAQDDDVASTLFKRADSFELQERAARDEGAKDGTYIMLFYIKPKSK